MQGRDIFTIQTFQNVSGTLGAIYRPNSSFQFITNLGTGWRPPHVNELFSDGLHHGAGVIEKGDNTLNSERGFKWIGTLTYAGNQGLSGEISVYYHRFFNFIFKLPKGIEKTIRGTFPVFQYTQTKARLQGIHISLSYTSPFGISLESKGTYLNALDLNQGEPLIYMPANWSEHSLRYKFKDGQNWSDTYVQAGFRQVFQQKNIPTRINPLERDFLPPPEGYELVKFEAGTRLWQTLDLGISIENLLNTSYRDYLNSFRYYTDETGRNISLRIKYIF